MFCSSCSPVEKLNHADLVDCLCACTPHSLQIRPYTLCNTLSTPCIQFLWQPWRCTLVCTTSTIAVASWDWLLPGQIADTVWTVSCDGTFVVQYLNDFGGEFIISIDGKEESRVSGEHHDTRRKQAFQQTTTVSMTASVKSHGNKKVLFSWACDAMPAALPSTLNTARGCEPHEVRAK